jgi:hypothetical protein
MPEILLVALILFVVFGLPLITAFFARSMNRPFWIWFGIGCVLPIISVFILFFLPDKSIKEE